MVLPGNSSHRTKIEMNKHQQNSKLSAIQKLSNSISERLKSKLSRRVVLCVFTSIIVIEGIILIPSVRRREQELLSQIKQMSYEKVAWILMTYPNPSGKELVNHLSELIQHNMPILGGDVYTADGQKIGTFGESPNLQLSDLSNSQKSSIKDLRYDDIIWSGQNMQTDYTIVIRHDASHVRAELLAYIYRIIGLVIIISLFLTITVWLCLEPIVINPILLLRCDLNKAGEAIYNDREPPTFDSVSLHRKDELGEVINAFELMYMKINEKFEEREATIKLQVQQLERTLEQLSAAQMQLVQTEKMSALGQLVGGISHELNNPVNFIHGNIRYAIEYFDSLVEMINLYQQEDPEPTPLIKDSLSKLEI